VWRFTTSRLAEASSSERENAVAEHVEIFCKDHRRHSAFGFQSPAEFEDRHARVIHAA
jgi:hypothetical protein